MPSLDDIWSPGVAGSKASLDDIWSGGTQAVQGAANWAGKNVASPLGRLLDSQRYGVAKAVTGESDPDAQRTAYRKKAGIEDFYQSTPHPVQGVIDFGLDTATDPLTYETMGGIIARKGALKAAGALTPLVKAAIENSPEAAQAIAGDLGKAGKFLGDTYTRMTAPGGKNVGDLQIQKGRGARDLLLGATGKHLANEGEMGKRLTTRFQQTIKGLTPDEEENVYRSLNGEPGVRAFSPQEQTAFQGLRKLADEAAYLEATPALRRMISLRQGGLRGGVRGKTVNANPLELEPLDPALAPEQQKIIAEHQKLLGLRSPSLSRAIYPMGRDIKKASKPVSQAADWAKQKAGLTPDEDFGDFLDKHAPKPKPLPLPYTHTASGVITNPVEDEVLGKRAARRTVRSADIKPLEVSPDIKDFVGPGGARDEYRYRYLPAPHKPEADEFRKTFEYNPLNWKNPNLISRDDFFVTQKQLPDIRDAFERMLKNASRESSRASLHRELEAKGLPVGPTVEKALEERVRGRGDKREGREVAEDLYKGALRYGRAAQVSLTPYHLANIGSLQLAHAPETIPKAAITAIRALMPGADRYKIFEKGRELGALGPSEVHEGGFQNIPGLKQYSNAMSNAVFTYDDAAKQALAEKYAKQGVGGGGYGAGRRAAEDLIDYSNPSEIGNALSWVSKFPTYRSQLPGSVARAVAKNPARIEAINRATGGVFTGGTAQTPVGPVKSYSSVADVGRAAGDPMSYARSTLGDLVKMAASGAKLTAGGKGPHYFTYGRSPISRSTLLSAALAGLPESRSILNELGLGDQQQNPGSSPLPEPLRQAIFDATALRIGQ